MKEPLDVTAWGDGHMVFLEMAGQGAVTGNVYEWPQLKPACRWAAEEIARLRVLLRDGESERDREYAHVEQELLNAQSAREIAWLVEKERAR